MLGDRGISDLCRFRKLFAVSPAAIVVHWSVKLEKINFYGRQKLEIGTHICLIYNENYDIHRCSCSVG